MRILGIDPGSIMTGFGIIEVAGQQSRALHFGVIKAGQGDFPGRLKIIFEGIQALIQEYQPDQMAVETVFMNRSAMSALKLGQARGAAVCAGVTLGLDVSEYEPRLIKQAIVGRGAADKVQVQHMIRVLLNLKSAPQEDAADALAVALCHQHHSQTQARIDRAIAGRQP